MLKDKRLGQSVLWCRWRGSNRFTDLISHTRTHAHTRASAQRWKCCGERSRKPSPVPLAEELLCSSWTLWFDFLAAVRSPAPDSERWGEPLKKTTLPWTLEAHSDTCATLCGFVILGDALSRVEERKELQAGDGSDKSRRNKHWLTPAPQTLQRVHLQNNQPVPEEHSSYLEKNRPTCTKAARLLD